MIFDIAVVLINYNSSEHSINCIRSIIQNTSNKLSYQIIITDNCSEKEDYLQLKTFCDNLDFPNLKLLRSSINTGFGGGNMFGLPFVNATFIAFINNDTLLKNDCLSILKNTLHNNPSIGIAGAQAYNQKGEFMISLDHFASPTREILGRNFLERVNSKKYPKRKQLYTQPTQVNFIPGSFMFVRATDFYEVGGFDTTIFLYYEETDLCLRLAKKHKFAYLVPQAEFIHFHGASTPSSIYIKTELKISLLYIIRKHYGYLSYLLVLNYLRINYSFSTLFKPKYWYLLKILIAGAPISSSIKTKQQIEVL
ncbi:glycosyltransferase family 2 protein [Flavobacterium ovatum]|uniref:glycosyltransferase family 2 protein n=1 Tax=Flavobacterium ovatum TaxID=1928857 RepID=UPI00344C38CF